MTRNLRSNANNNPTVLEGNPAENKPGGGAETFRYSATNQGPYGRLLQQYRDQAAIIFEEDHRNQLSSSSSQPKNVVSSSRHHRRADSGVYRGLRKVGI
jgi:hypothetical protein